MGTMHMAISLFLIPVQKTIPEILFSTQPCVVVDVGARNGFQLLRALHPYISLHEIEPEPLAAQQLRLPVSRGAFAKKEVHELIVGREGKVMLNVTARPSMSSVLQPDPDEFAHSFGGMKNVGQWKAEMQVVNHVEVQGMSLAAFCYATNIEAIDFLKIDTQGSELEILRSAEQMLREGKIAVICTEVSFNRLYKTQGIFSEIDLFLRDCGFHFVDCRFYRDVTERENEFAPGKIHERPKMTTVGDAWYVFDYSNRVNNFPRAAVRAGIVLATEGFFSEAHQLMQTHSSEQEREQLFRSLTQTSSRTRFKEFLKRWLPPAILQWRAKRKS